MTNHTRINQTLVLSVCALGLFIDGYDLFIAALAEPFIKQSFHPSPLLLGLIQSSALLGAIIGSITIGRLADLIGRKSMLLMNLLFFVVVALLSSVAWNIPSLILFRFLIGFGVGADYPIVAAYLAEMIKPTNRKQAMALCMFINCLASPFVALIAYIVYQSHPDMTVWRTFFALGALPAAIGLLLRAKLPESFTWKAMADLKKSPSNYTKLFNPNTGRKTFILCATWFFMNMTNYGIGLFTPSILHELAGHLSFTSHADSAILNTLMINSFVMLGAFISIFVIKHYSIISLQRLGFFMAFIRLVLVSLSPAHYIGIMFFGFILFNFFINLGPGITTYYLPAVLYPSDIRASGHGLASGIAKLGAFIGTLLLPILQSILGIKATILLLSSTLLVGFWLSGLLIKSSPKKKRYNHELLVNS